MKASWLNDVAIGVVRLLLRLYPPKFRRRFRAEMLEDFRERLEDRATLGSVAVMRLLARTSVDLIATAAREWFAAADRDASDWTSIDPSTSRQSRVLDHLFLDLRFALRSLRRRPGFTAIAVITLALGVGANTAIFSAVNVVLLRPLPLGDPDRLVMVWEEDRAKGLSREKAAPANFYDWREGVQAFREVAAYGTGLANLAGDGLPEVLASLWVTGNFFDVLGVRAAHGRTFREAETWGDAPRVVVLSDGFWARRFGRDPSIIGSMITVDEVPREVIGIMPPGIDAPERGLDLWQPLAWERSGPQRRWFRQEHFLRVVARLDDNATLEEADAQLRVVAQRLEQQYPETNRSLGAGITPLQDFLAGEARNPLLILLGATGLLLLLTCANVANLLLVRASGRGREVAVRTALGAGRGRIALQLLTESIVLAFAGGVVGLAAGLLAIRVLLALQPPGAWRLSEVPIDARVLLFALAVTLVSGILFGLAPAFRAANVTAGLKQGVRTTAGRSSRRASELLVIVELALAVVLVTGGGLLLRSFVALRQVDPGFQTEDRVGAQVVLPPRYRSDEGILGFVDEIVTRLEAIPGVEAVTYMSQLPLAGTTWTRDFAVEGRGPDERGTYLGQRNVAPNYFGVMGVPLLRGRTFESSDRVGSEPVTIINREMVRQYFPNEDPIGRRITFTENPNAAPTWYRIVGVVGDEHQNGMNVPPQIEAFFPYRQSPTSRPKLVLHVPGDEAAMAEVLRRELAAVDPLLPLAEFTTLDDVYARSLGRDRFLLTLIGAFAALALLLATVGVYGVTAEAAKRRTQEIGIRIALGARAGEVARMILSQGLTLTAVGVLLGLAGALAGTRLLASVLYGVAPRDAVTFLAVPAVLALSAGIACALPALRAARLDPVVALKHE